MTNFKSFKDGYVKIEGDGEAKAGGQGTTHKVKKNFEKDENIYIVKTLNKNNDSERRARMRRECISLETLSEPGIPKIIDSNTEFYKDNDYRLFSIMEYIE